MKINSITTTYNKQFGMTAEKKANNIPNYSPVFKQKILYINNCAAKNILLKHSEKIKKFSKENQNKLHDLLRTFEENCFYNLDCVDLFLTDTNPNVDKFTSLINRFIKEKINTYHLQVLLKYGKEKSKDDCINFEAINKYLDFRLVAQKNKHLLDRYNTIGTNKDIDDILLNNYITAVAKTIDLIGEQAFIYSFKDKKDNVIDYIQIIGLPEWTTEIYDTLKKYTNPTATSIYKDLEKEISNLKTSFNSSSNENKTELISRINELTKIKRELIRQSIKDPKDILEKSLIIAALNSNGLTQEAFRLLKIINPITKEENLEYKKELNRFLFKYFQINPENKTSIEIFNFENNKYLPKLFYAKQDFKKNFKKLVELIENNPEKNNIEIFNELPQNIQTKKIFEELNIDYKAWSETNPDSKIEYCNPDNSVIKAQKADLNNITKGLSIGEDVSCCTKLTGVFARCAVPYITSKMIQAIEICHNEMPIANTMCYLAKVNGSLSLILDNIEVKPQYQDERIIRDLIFEYAEKLTEEIGCKDIPILLSAKRNDITTRDLPKYLYNISIVGNSGKDPIYLDFNTKDICIDNTTRNFNSIELIPISKNQPIGGKQIEDEFIISSNGNDYTIYRQSIDLNYD